MAGYTVRGIFAIGFTAAEILEIKAAAVARLKNGGGLEITNYSNQGVAVGKLAAMDPGDLIMECDDGLRRVDPDTYGYTRTGRRVHANFGGSNPL